MWIVLFLPIFRIKIFKKYIDNVVREEYNLHYNKNI